MNNPRRERPLVISTIHFKIENPLTKDFLVIARSRPGLRTDRPTDRHVQTGCS